MFVDSHCHINFEGLAERQLPVLRDVLRNSSDVEHRAIAAYIIGYAPKKRDVVADLQQAIQDPEDGVRDNAIRAMTAISVLAAQNPDLEIQISPTWPCSSWMLDGTTRFGVSATTCWLACRAGPSPPASRPTSNSGSHY